MFIFCKPENSTWDFDTRWKAPDLIPSAMKAGEKEKEELEKIRETRDPTLKANEKGVVSALMLLNTTRMGILHKIAQDIPTGKLQPALGFFSTFLASKSLSKFDDFASSLQRAAKLHLKNSWRLKTGLAPPKARGPMMKIRPGSERKPETRKSRRKGKRMPR